MTPKLKTLDFIKNNPSIAYFGDMYPLHAILPKELEISVR